MRRSSNSARNRRIIELVQRGSTFREIATELGISPGTVSGVCHRAGVKGVSHAERMRQLHADPEFRAANAERMRQRNADPEFRAAHAERMRQRHAENEEVPIDMVDELAVDLDVIAETYGAITSGAVSDWFGISDELAMRLLGAIDPRELEPA